MWDPGGRPGLHHEKWDENSIDKIILKVTDQLYTSIAIAQDEVPIVLVAGDVVDDNAIVDTTTNRCGASQEYSRMELDSHANMPVAGMLTTMPW